MLLHAKHASPDAQRIVIQSPDTDVLLLCVPHFEDIRCSELWFRTGIKDHLRFIPAHKISQEFHAITGCESTSALSSLGKKKAWKVLLESGVHQESLRKIGELAEINEEKARDMDAFVYSLYGMSKRMLMKPVVFCSVKKHKIICYYLQLATAFYSTARELSIKPMFGEKLWWQDRFCPSLTLIPWPSLPAALENILELTLSMPKVHVQ